MNHTKQEEILRFWFGEDSLHPLANQQKWFSKDPAFDMLVTEKFGAMLADAETGAFDDWPKSKNGSIAAILLCDQFPRHVFRDEPRALAFDERALRAAQIAIAHGFDKTMSHVERCFLYLPYEHSERLEDQQRAVELFSELARHAHEAEGRFIASALDYAIRHHEIISRYGRFPHRNQILGRASTKDEQRFLRQPGAFF